MKKASAKTLFKKTLMRELRLLARGFRREFKKIVTGR